MQIKYDKVRLTVLKKKKELYDLIKSVYLDRQMLQTRSVM